MKTIYIGSDHAGFALKEKLKASLKSPTVKLVDLTPNYDPNDDYPDAALAVGKKVASGNGDVKGILVCGSAEGICIAANKVHGVRAVVAFNEQIAKVAKEHNNANILCLSGGAFKDKNAAKKFTGLSLTPAKATRVVKAWLNAKFSSEPRHLRRVRKIARMEQ